MSTIKYYTIEVPHKEIAASYENAIDKDTQLPKGDLVPVHLKLGNVVLPNFSRVWAVRGKDAKGNPNGNLEFLKWGTKNSAGKEGEAVEIRWLPNSSSLDKAYQQNVQKLNVSDEDTAIYLTPGLNEFDVDKKAKLIEFLKIHTLNADSICRDPDNQNILFHNYKEDVSLDFNIAERRKKKELEDILLEAEMEGHTTVLAHIFGLDAKSENHTIMRTLFSIIDRPASKGAESGYKYFEKVLNETKSKIEAEIRFSVEEGLMKGEEDREITYIDSTGKSVPIFKDAIQKGDSTVKFFMENILKEKFYDAYLTLQPIIKQARELVV